MIALLVTDITTDMEEAKKEARKVGVLIIKTETIKTLVQHIRQFIERYQIGVPLPTCCITFQKLLCCRILAWGT